MEPNRPRNPYDTFQGKFTDLCRATFEAGVTACEATHEAIRQEERARIAAELRAQGVALQADLKAVRGRAFLDIAVMLDTNTLAPKPEKFCGIDDGDEDD